MEEAELGKLTFGAQQLVRDVLEKYQPGQPQPGIHYWMLALLERFGPMAESMVPGLVPADLIRSYKEKVGKGEAGAPLDPSTLVREAVERAQKRGKTQGTERDTAAIILIKAGYKPAEVQTFTAPASDGDSSSQPEALRNTTPQAAASSTPNLDKFGRDLTKEAREGKFAGSIGRLDEIERMVEILCRRTKRNPVLIGPAGVGKTAIVEGFAYQIANGQVPNLLKNARLVAIQPSVLVAGANIAGELEKRVQAVIKEASQPGIILFIDEIHTIMGSGGMMGLSDVGSLLKPSLARGEIACIAATTNDEYRRFIENDAALERRFNPIRVNELTPDETLQVLKALRDIFTKTNGIDASDDVLGWLVQFGDQYMRNRHFPDKAVDLLEQCVAHAVMQNRTTVELGDAQEVAQRMVGMPLGLEERLAKLQKELTSQALLGQGEIDALVSRLKVTMRGLDIRSNRPNAILLLTGEVRNNSDQLARTIADAMYGDEDRVITIDFSRLVHPEDINLLVGAPPGYVGYTDSLPLHRLAQIPWCVLRFENIDSCHPYIREVVTQGFRDGWLMDGRGKSLFLSDTIVLLSADITLETHRSLGFFQPEESLDAQDVHEAVRGSVGDELVGVLDLLLFGASGAGAVSQEWLQENLLEDVEKRYSKQGLVLHWDESLVKWLLEVLSEGFSESDWVRWVDHILTPAVIDLIPSSRSAKKVVVTVEWVDGELSVKPKE